MAFFKNLFGGKKKEEDAAEAERQRLAAYEAALFRSFPFLLLLFFLSFLPSFLFSSLLFTICSISSRFPITFLFFLGGRSPPASARSSGRPC